MPMPMPMPMPMLMPILDAEAEAERQGCGLLEFCRGGYQLCFVQLAHELQEHVAVTMASLC